jgi:antitoxin (DNA-binding transcriptional repressor) of toxin-antitoxin stability system
MLACPRRMLRRRSSSAVCLKIPYHWLIIWNNDASYSLVVGMAGTQTVIVTEFKANCLEILDKVASHSLGKVMITERGQVVAMLVPPIPEAKMTSGPKGVEGLYGFLRGSMIIAEDADLTESACDEPFHAETGRIHE